MAAPPKAPGRAGFLLRALRHRNYRLFFSGQSVSLVGTWLTRLATAWLVYRLTSSALLLGLVSFAGQLPTLLLAPFGGVVVDRFSRHKVLVITQVLSMLQSFALAALALLHIITVWEIAALGALQGLINAFDAPARQAFVFEMVEDPADLSNAIALNSSMVNGARLVGPSIAGILIAVAGEGGCFLIDGISYLAVIASLLLMNVAPPVRRAQAANLVEELRTGFAYTFGFAPRRALLLLLALISLMGMPYTVLMPVMAARFLHGGAATLGSLMAATGCGALLGALYLASRRSVVGLGKWVVGSAALFGAALVAFAFSRWLWLSLPVLVVVGLGMMVQMAATNTILQVISDEAMRGRVMSFYTMAFMGTAPLGSLFSGELAAHVAAPWTIAIGGLACIAGAAYFARALPSLREQVRPIYVRLGILEEVATGMQAASQRMSAGES